MKALLNEENEGELEVGQIEEGVKELVEKASTKAKKVIVSTIVKREDREQYNIKVEVINANIKYAYMNNDKVLVCDNRNLNDSKFRVRDGIHLTPHGTSVLANNIKFKVAKALDIRIEKNERWE